ncbi:MAG: AMIN domain-containing protein [Longimicrobiales bacterium]
MITTIALWLAALFAPDSQITWLSVSPVSDRTEVVIRVEGTVTVKDFMMDDGRLVVDITGARQSQQVSQTINRGGISRVRIGPFQPNVARVVVELSQPLEYKVTQEEGLIRVRFPNRGGLFEPWSAQVNSRTAAAEPAAKQSVPLGKVEYERSAPKQVRVQEPLLIVTYRDRPLSEVLGDISSLSGRTILASPKVKASPITADIMAPGLPWSVALETILEANGLIQRTLPNGAIIVEDQTALAERDKNQTLVTVNIPLQHVDADSVAVAVQSALTPVIGRVSFVQASNSLLVTDAQAGVDRVMSIIKLIDVPSAMVDIDAVIAFVDRTTLEAMGVVYDLKDSRGTQLRGLADNFNDENGNGVFDPNESTTDNVILLGGNSIAALGNANVRVAGPALTLATSLVLGRHTLISFLEALQTVSLSDIQAKPMVRTLDNYLARIQVGERTPIRVVDAQSAGGAGAPRAQVRTENTGIILEVTPHVTGNQIQLRMHAERSNIGAAGGGEITFQTQQSDNVVVVQDGQTVVVGGLTIVEKTKSRTGIPFLMDLPVIGALFRNDREQENKRDLLVLVTPHIVREQ